jgi:hypothetical protein
MADLTKINTYDRIDADLDDWEQSLKDIRRLITMGELSRDGDEFQDARRKIAEMLEGVRQTREFIEFKRNMVVGTTADVEALLVDGEPAVPFNYPDGLPQPDEDVSL